MRKLNVYISEKLILNKQSRIKEFNADDLNDTFYSVFDSTVYADYESENFGYSEFIKEIKRYSKDYKGFICYKHPITQSKDVFKDLNHYYDKLDDCIYDLFKWENWDDGFVDIIHGHLEIETTKSNHKNKYYVYLLSDKANERVLNFIQNKTFDDSDLSFLLTEEGNIIPIDL